MFKIELKSPYYQGGEVAVFNCTFGTNINNEAVDIFRIIRFISEDFIELEQLLSKHNEAYNSYNGLINLVQEYNLWLAELKPLDKNVESRASNGLIKYLMYLIYNRAILDPDKLNHYEPFSPEVYGETSFDLIDSLLSRVPLNSNDVFMDLGSGVGNVVLHVAAAVKCKCCYGFEKAEWPAFYAKRMEKEFKFWMGFFGKAYSDFKLYKGDFLSDEEYVELPKSDKSSESKRLTMNDYVKEIINESNLIFVNNYAFGAEVDHQLKLRFCNMLENSMIVSSKPFCSLNFRINSRNLNDIGTILNINFEPLNGKVSWTDRPINYYFHKIDRTLLEKYFERLNKNPSRAKDDDFESDMKHRKSTSSLTISTSSGSSSSACSSPASSTDSYSSSSSPSGDNHRSLKKARSISSNRKSIDGNKKNKKRKKSTFSPEDLRSTNRMISKKRPKLVAPPPSKENSLNKFKTAAVSRSKSLDKESLMTLTKMHQQVVKPAKVDSNRHSTIRESASFNLKTMSKLKDENLDNKLLKDCKISPKLMKSFKKDSLETNNRSSSLSRLPNSETKTKMTKPAVGSTGDVLTEEEKMMARCELGDHIMNVVDSYLKKCQKQYIQYLIHLKSSDYEEKIKFELKNEKNKKNELLNRKEKVETLTNSMLKTNIGLLKKRAEELGIKNLESPYQLIEYARNILTDNKQLNKKINSVQQKVNNLELKQKLSKKSNNATDEELQGIAKSNSRLQSLDLLLRTIDSKYSLINGADKKFQSQYDKLSVNLDCNEKYLGNCDEMTQIKSVGSNRSDETLTATERGGDDDDNMAELDDEINDIIRINEALKLKKAVKQTSPKAVTSPIAPSEKYDQFLHNNRSLDGWRSFKIPKQQSKPDDQTKETASSPGSSSSSSNGQQAVNTTNSGSIPRQTSNDSTSSSSSSFIDGDQSNKKSYSASYYHPKKKQFRQYMMENLSSCGEKLFEKVLGNSETLTSANTNQNTNDNNSLFKKF